jgi:hypothetical protein
MDKINLKDIRDREYYGVPIDIARIIDNKNHSLFFKGFDTYIEKDENDKIVATFHTNEFDYYRNGLLNK